MTKFTSYMEIALAEARAAADRGEVPVGAVLVDPSGTVVAQDGNRTREQNDPTAHAEIMVLRAGCSAAGSERLPGYDLYVTLEPCPMCAGAIQQARVGRLVYGAPDQKVGSAGSVVDTLRDPRLLHRVEVVGGVLAEDSIAVLQDFFNDRR